MKDVYILKVIDKTIPVSIDNVEIIDFADISPDDEFIKLQGNPLELAHNESKTFLATSSPHPNQQGIGTVEGNFATEFSVDIVEALISFVYEQEGEQRNG